VSEVATTQSKTDDEVQIRHLIEERVNAIHARDLDRLMSNHARDVQSFDVVDPLQYAGRDRVRQRAADWFASYESSVGYEIRDLNVAVGDEVAFCHYLYRVSGTLKSGGQVNMWVRATVCYRKVGGTWLITHEHNSVPFNAETGRASLDLEP
jgi:uncharacterized protein (TIGR02246 family)